MLCLFLAVFDFFGSCLIFDFSYKEQIVKFVRRCFGRLDGSIRALRKVRFRSDRSCQADSDELIECFVEHKIWNAALRVILVIWPLTEAFCNAELVL